MSTTEKTILTVAATVNAPVEKVWKTWSTPEDIMKWNSPSDDWHTPSATNDLRPGGKFTSRMEAKDGSWGFDFAGIYDAVEEHKLIEYTIADGRTVKVVFEANGNTTTVTEFFEPESENPIEMQQAGWQAIMDNFKKYTESV
ncbi:SRPBCC family protein [Chitinophaga tropicalis]|uniref:Polyketide cyclase n=1 Tax=Chitinophaga tropicalis TaxID=2683588 RepID=A0A7K1UD47_9BACT|nr:SRPBCC family protein [Chitinophaga tropicalis]MVT12299.1 polyketide cyclase [Chitinophaga tropicalis]